MHGRTVEEMRIGDDQGLQVGRAERDDLCVTVAAGGDEHGDGLAHPAQPEAAAPSTSEAHADMAVVRREGGCQHEDDGPQVRGRAVEQMGGSAGTNTAPLRQGIGPDVVTGPVSTANVLALLERQGYRCALTGRRLTPETAALDHIVPLRFGGEHVIQNTQVLHKDVNRAKNSMTNVEFARMCEEVAEAWRRRVPSAPTLPRVAEGGGPAGNRATSNHNATRGDDAAAAGHGWLAGNTQGASHEDRELGH